MSQRMAKLFVSSAVVFFILGCLEGMMFPSKFTLQSLFAKVRDPDSERISFGQKFKDRKRSESLAALLLPIVLAGMLTLPAHRVSASPKPVPEKLPVIMIGDRLVDVAYHLGVLPAAMSVRCSMWPTCKKLQSAVQVVGCPNCVKKKKAEPLLSFAEKHGIKRVIFEKSSPFCLYKPDLDLKTIASLLGGNGFDIQYVDFTKGLESAIQQAAALLKREEKAEKVIAHYAKAMEKVRSKIEMQTEKRVVIVNGIYQPSTGKSTLRIEAPGGYSDTFLLEKLGCVNVGDGFKPANGKASKGHYPVKKKKSGFVLDGLITANPDVIVMTGDAFAVQKALADYAAANSKFAQVNAIKTMAIFALPAYVDSGVREYPEVLRKWSAALLP